MKKYDPYQCDFCGKIENKEEMIEHELKCEWNPKSKSCHTCMNSINRGEIAYVVGENAYDCPLIPNWEQISGFTKNGNCPKWEPK